MRCLLLVALVACSPTLTPADRYEIEAHDLTLAKCRDVGRDAGSYTAYDACKKGAGIR